MLATLYVNPFFWIIVTGGLLGWARFVLWVSEDVETLRKQSLTLWRSISVCSLVVLTLIWVLVPMFWLALILALLVAGGVITWYWMVRVGELGPRGHLLAGVIRRAGEMSQGAKARRAAGQVALMYARADDSAMPLPQPDDPTAPGLSLTDEVLSDAMAKRTDIIELIPTPKDYDLRFTVDGIVYPQQTVARTEAESIIQAAKNMAGLSIGERRRPQQGLFKVRGETGIPTSWTVRTSGTTIGERMAASANEKGRWNIPLDQIGLAADQLAAVRAMVQETEGVVLVAAPKQHGRTATLYSLIRSHDAFTNSIQTLESTPQDELEGVTVNRFDPQNAESSYAKALQSIFLKDPNVVLSQQCPDSQTAASIARYGGEAHRVYVGLTAFDTMAALDLWLRIVTDNREAIKSLRAIIAQRLIRLLCPTCKIAYQPDEATLRKYNLPIGRNLQSFKANTEPLVDARGNRYICETCTGTGYRGRTGIFEVLMVTNEIKQAILGGANLQGVRGMARKNNMMLLVEHGFRKFASGLTSIQEVARVMTPEKAAGPSAASGVHRPPAA